MAAVLAAGMTLAVAGAAQAQIFQDEIVRLLDTHPEIKAERARTEAAEAGVDEALGAFLPRVDLTGSEAYAVIDLPPSEWSKS
ncbi:MAG: TolC family protein [Proteobacteria bacterium]|nr:TolC family protein [Pseudomonadota bacterium]